ncbi:MAG: tetratricopeptide repeat protein [Bacteroidetes bacterium]|jgi:TolA-binding protein|nr:tetratricopeptide repeat protein [Bacteroidota bacterium]
MRRFSSLSLALLLFLAQPALPQDSKENADFKLALNLYNDRFYDLALEQFRQFIAYYGSSQQAIEARYYLGLTQSNLGRQDEARFTFQNFALSYPENPKAPEAWLRVAESYEATGDRAEAALAYERVRTFHPRSRQAPFALQKAADLFESLGDRTSAMRVLKTLTQEYGSADVVEARLRLATYFIEAGQFDAAAQESRKVLEGSKDANARAEAQLVNARLAVAMRRPRAAEDALQDILKNYRASAVLPAALFQLAELKEATGDHADAAAAWRSVAEDTGRVSSDVRQHAFIRIGRSLALRRDAAGARRAFEAATRLAGPRRTTAALEAGRLAELAGDTSTAARWYERAADDTTTQGDRTAYMIAGVKAARWTSRWDEVVRRVTLFGQASPSDPATPTLWLWAGHALETGLSDPVGAEPIFERLAADPAAASIADAAAYGAARCARARGDLPEAKRRFEQFATRFSASPLAPAVAADLRIMTLFEMRDRDAGTEQLALLLGDVIGEQQRSALAFRLAEISFAQLKNYDLAQAQYRRALLGGLESSLRPTAWYKAGVAASSEAERPGISRALRDRWRNDAIALFDSLLHDHPDHPLSSDGAVSLVELRAVRAASVADLRAIAGEVDSLYVTHRQRDKMYLTLAERASALKAPDAALTWWSAAAAAGGDRGRSVEATYQIALQLEARGDRDSAQSLMAGIAERDMAHPRGLAAALRAARLSADKGDQAAVERWVDRARRTAPYAVDPVTLDLLLADGAFGAEAWTTAADRYAAARRRIEEDRLEVRQMPASSAFRMAVANQRIGRNDEAARWYGEVISRETDPTILLTSYTALAALAEARNDLPRASAHMQEAARISAAAGGDVNAVALESADLLFRNEQYAEAITRYSDLLSKNVSDSLRQRLESQTINAYLRLDNLKEADRRIGLFVKKYPKAASDVAVFEFERGKHLLRKEKTSGARERFELVVRQYPNTPTAAEAWFWLGRTYELDQEVPRAAEVYDSVLQRYPQHALAPRVRLSLGNALYALEQWDRASALFKAVMDDPKSSADLVQFAMNNLILTYKEQALFDAALQMTRRYIDQYPDDPELMNKRIDIGVLYQKLGYNDQSVTHLQNLLQTAGADLEAELRYYIGEAYHYKGDHQQAILEFLKVPYLVTRSGPVDWVAASYYMAGQSYEKMSRFDQAVAMYRQIIQRPGIDPSFKTAAQREIDRVRQLTGDKN